MRVLCGEPGPAKKASAGGMEGSDPASMEGDMGERPNCDGGGGEVIVMPMFPPIGTKTGAIAEGTEVFVLLGICCSCWVSFDAGCSFSLICCCGGGCCC
jgi:hypothetical protein